MMDRYFKREWETEYYIFDSKVISEEEFDDKIQYEDYRAFIDCMMGDEVVNRLNDLNKENQKLKQELDSLQNRKNLNSIHSHKKIMGLMEENKELKQELEDGLCPLCGARVSKCGGLKQRKEGS